MQTSTANVGISTHYVAFDKKTGRIVGMHSRYSVQAKGHVRMTRDELVKFFSRDSEIVGLLTDRDPGNLDILELSDHKPGGSIDPMMVDVKHRTLVPQPSLSLTADRKEIAGDGSDSVEIRIAVHAANNHVLRSCNGHVKVTTTRGKLSARGGLVELKDGVAAITLTSVPETVSKVRVQAQAVDVLAATGLLVLEFV